MADLLLTMDIEEHDGVCRQCPRGPHLHLATRAVVEASLLRDAVTQLPIERAEREAETRRLIAEEMNKAREADWPGRTNREPIEADT